MIIKSAKFLKKTQAAQDKARIGEFAAVRPRILS
jgi:hypothetical protein